MYSNRDKSKTASIIGILLAQKYENNIVKIEYISDKLIQVTLELQKS